MRAVYNVNATWGVLNDQQLLGIQGTNDKFVSDIWFDGYQLRVSDKHCVTVSKCVPNPPYSTCDPSVTEPAVNHVQAGAFVRLGPCLSTRQVLDWSLAQTLTRYEHNCSMEQLDPCECEDLDALFPRCGDSPVFISPTNSPTTSPSWRPTVSPSLEEEEDSLTLSPSPAPSSTPSTIPSSMPSNLMLRTPTPTLVKPPTSESNTLEEKPVSLSSLALLALPIGVLAHYFFSRRQ